MFWRGSIQRRLFLSYSAVVLTLIVLFALLAYVYISRTLARNATDYMLAQADRIGFETDALLDDANKLSGKLLFSQDLLDLFYSDMFQYKSGSVAKQHEFNGLIYSIIGPQSSPYQINLFRPSGEFAGFGLTALITNQRPAAIASIPWLQECLDRDGSKLIVTTHADDFGYQRQPIVSLCRAFASRWGRPKDSINEIQVPYSQIDSVVQRQLVGTQGGQVFIFDPTGGLVFPPGPLPSAAAYFEAVSKATGPATVTRSIDGRLQVLAHRPTRVGDWTVVVTRDYDSVFEPVRRFRNGAMLASAAVLFLTLLVTYAISRSLTRPIKQMHQSVAQLTLETLPDEQAFKIETNVNELQELSSAFRTMTVRLRESVQEAVAARSSALQARLLALQAQMNPHFLYNMLTTVSILAEKGKSQQVVTVCDSLSDMLRYVSSSGAQLVTIAEEMRHAQLYAELMGVRFADELTFVFDVPDEADDRHASPANRPAADREQRQVQHNLRAAVADHGHGHTKRRAMDHHGVRYRPRLLAGRAGESYPKAGPFGGDHSSRSARAGRHGAAEHLRTAGALLRRRCRFRVRQPSRWRGLCDDRRLDHAGQEGV